MCCQVRSASVSRRRRKQRRKPPFLSPPVVIDLSKPGERQAHDFLVRGTSRRGCMWTLLDLRRHEDVLLCRVRLAHPDAAANPFSLAEVSLCGTAVHWRNYATAKAARVGMERCCRAMSTSERPA
jgi:hypothetical protein